MLNDSPNGWSARRPGRSANRAVPARPRRSTGASRRGTTSSPGGSSEDATPRRRPRRRQGHRQRLRVDPVRIGTDVKRQDRFWIKSQPYSLRGHAGRRRVGRASSPAGPSTRRSSTPTTTTAGTAPSRARSAGRSSARGRISPRRNPRGRIPGPQEVAGLSRARRDPGDLPDRGRRPRDRPDGRAFVGMVRRLLVRDPSGDRSRAGG